MDFVRSHLGKMQLCPTVRTSSYLCVMRQIPGEIQQKGNNKKEEQSESVCKKVERKN